MRAVNFGDLWFVDHVDISVACKLFLVLLIEDAASNLVWAGAQRTKGHEETISAYLRCIDELAVRPRAIRGDRFFAEPAFQSWYKYNCVKFIDLGPYTPLAESCRGSSEVVQASCTNLV